MTLEKPTEIRSRDITQEQHPRWQWSPDREPREWRETTDRPALDWIMGRDRVLRPTPDGSARNAAALAVAQRQGLVEMVEASFIDHPPRSLSDKERGMLRAVMTSQAIEWSGWHGRFRGEWNGHKVYAEEWTCTVGDHPEITIPAGDPLFDEWVGFWLRLGRQSAGHMLYQASQADADQCNCDQARELMCQFDRLAQYSRGMEADLNGQVEQLEREAEQLRANNQALRDELADLTRRYDDAVTQAARAISSWVVAQRQVDELRAQLACHRRRPGGRP
jgi:hypothetical protein